MAAGAREGAPAAAVPAQHTNSVLENTMTTHRHCACLLLTAHLALGAQTPLPPPPPPMPAPYPEAQQQGLPTLQRPFTGAALNAPTSAAATRFADLPTVAIREFRSSVGEVLARGATDMFIAALVNTRKFRVLERARLVDGIGAEKSLNQQGMSTGEVGRSQYLGAVYLFEATISEASAGDRASSFTLGVAGAVASRGTASDSIAIDVRVIDVQSGVIVDAITVRKEIHSEETKAGGVTFALANILTKGRGGAAADVLASDDKYLNARKDSVDRTLREAIEEAVATLARRLAAP